MPRSDDSREFPPGRRRRPRAPQPGPETRGADWRYPDPTARYGQEYDEEYDEEHDVPRSRQEVAEDEWRRAPGRDEQDLRFDDAPEWQENFPETTLHDRFAPSWDNSGAADDPFEWDAPEPTDESGWSDNVFGDSPRVEAFRGDDGYDSGTFGRPDPWSADERDRYRTPRGEDPGANPRSAREGSLFHGIDGAPQNPDLSSLTEAGRPNPRAEDPHAPEFPADPADLRDRFFSVLDSSADPYRDTPSEAVPRGNVFDFDAHRSATEPSFEDDLDDPYAWDDHGDEAPRPHFDSAPYTEAYPAGYDEYSGYQPDVPLQLEDDQIEDDQDADFLEDTEYEDPAPVSEQPRSRRKLMVAGVLVAAVATGGAAAFVYKSFQDGSLGDIETPTLLADSDPVKSKPSDPGGREFPDSNKQIYDRLSGEPVKPTEQSETKDTGDTDTTSIPGIVTTGAQAPADTLDERIAEALRKSGKTDEDASDSTTADPDSPRSVRTLTVRPDGSVVTTKADQADTSTKQAETSPSPATAELVSTTTSDPEERQTATSQADEAITQPETPKPRPTTRTEARSEETKVASAEPTTSEPSTASTTSANPYFVQLAARRDQTSALAAFADLQQKYPNILDGLAPTIKRADLGDKGVWYRLWVGPMETRGNAQDVCGKLKNAGLGGCFVRTP